MKKFEDAKLKRREQLIIDLQQENEELKKQLVDEGVLRDKQKEVDALIYQLNELQSKLCEEIKQFEEARKNFIAEKRKYMLLNVKYKKKMEKYLKQLGYKEEDDT